VGAPSSPASSCDRGFDFFGDFSDFSGFSVLSDFSAFDFFVSLSLLLFFSRPLSLDNWT
jgi:hypothetical protein